MNLDILQMEILWPKEIDVSNLRQWLLKELMKYGEPLRWAITSIEHADCEESLFERKLKIEAVIMTSSASSDGID